MTSRREIYNERYYKIAALIDALPGVSVPAQLPEVTIVGDSIQFNVDAAEFGDDLERATATFVQRCSARGLPVELFGSPNNARNFKNWKYAAQPECGLPRTHHIIQRAFDVRLPISFDQADLDTIVTIIKEELADLIEEFTTSNEVLNVPKTKPVTQYAR